MTAFTLLKLLGASLSLIGYCLLLYMAALFSIEVLGVSRSVVWPVFTIVIGLTLWALYEVLTKRRPSRPS